MSVDTEKAPSRPVVRYHGGKWRLAPWIISHFPPHRNYVEPYAGGASVLMREPRAHAEIINDIDGEIVNVFRVLRNPSQAVLLAEALRLTPYSRAEFNSAVAHEDDFIERARCTIVRSFMGFGSGGIQHKHSGFRVAISERRHTAREWQHFAERIPDFTTRLAGVVVESRPALDVIRRFDEPDTLIYCDPPYVHESRGKRHRYRYEMTDSDHAVLAGALNDAQGMVVLSGYNNDAYSALYRDWHTVEKSARDAMARDRTEVLWLNKACSHALSRASA